MIVYKVFFCSKFPNILVDNGTKMRRRRRTQTITKHYVSRKSNKIYIYIERERERERERQRERVFNKK